MTHFLNWERMLSRKKVLLIDNQPIFRAGLQHLLAEDGRWEVAAETADSRQGAQLARDRMPEVVFLGLKHPECVETLAQLRKSAHASVIIVFTDAAPEAVRLEILRAGANACVPRRMALEELAVLLTRLAEAAAPLEPVHPHPDGQLGQASAPLEPAAPQPDDPRAGEQPGQWLHQLTRQQRRILSLLATGKCNKRIGRELGISEGTVKVHLKSLYKKMNCTGRTQAISCFLRDPALRPQHRHIGI